MISSACGGASTNLVMCSLAPPQRPEITSSPRCLEALARWEVQRKTRRAVGVALQHLTPVQELERVSRPACSVLRPPHNTSVRVVRKVHNDQNSDSPTVSDLESGPVLR